MAREAQENKRAASSHDGSWADRTHDHAELLRFRNPIQDAGAVVEQSAEVVKAVQDNPESCGRFPMGEW